MAANTHEALEPVSFLIGRWEGVGVADYPGGAEFQFGQEVEFGADGGPLLTYRSTAWRVTTGGNPGELVTSEAGYWRIRSAEERSVQAGEGVEPHLEVFITHAEGFTELYYGTVLAGRIEMVTDAVLRGESAPEATAGHRLYGLVGEDRSRLGYAWDLSASTRAFQMSAQLTRLK